MMSVSARPITPMPRARAAGMTVVMNGRRAGSAGFTGTSTQSNA